VTVRLSGNNGYRLLVRRLEISAAGVAGRVWVRGVDGKFHELTPRSTVTIGDEPPAGAYQQEILYRLEDLTNSGSTLKAPPIHYDIAVKPLI
jgi:hypothetical protein